MMLLHCFDFVDNSGFSFIGGGVEGAAKPRNTDDSFSFITAEMNAERNRKK